MECGHHGHVLALYIKTDGNIVVVEDLLRSVCLLRYRVSDGTLEEIARDFDSNYMRSVEILDDSYILGAEDHGNVFVLKRNAEAISDEEKCRLDMQSGYHIGDYVNVFVRGTLSNASVTKPVGGEIHFSIALFVSSAIQFSSEQCLVQSEHFSNCRKKISDFSPCWKRH